MSKLNRTAIIHSGVRGFVCASLATVITALVSWTFVASTDHLGWMGSGARETPAAAMIQEGTGSVTRAVLS